MSKFYKSDIGYGKSSKNFNMKPNFIGIILKFKRVPTKILKAVVNQNNSAQVNYFTLYMSLNIAIFLSNKIKLLYFFLLGCIRISIFLSFYLFFMVFSYFYCYCVAKLTTIKKVYLLYCLYNLLSNFI